MITKHGSFATIEGCEAVEKIHFVPYHSHIQVIANIASRFFFTNYLPRERSIHVSPSHNHRTERAFHDSTGAVLSIKKTTYFDPWTLEFQQHMITKLQASFPIWQLHPWKRIYIFSRFACMCIDHFIPWTLVSSTYVHQTAFARDNGVTDVVTKKNLTPY